MTDIDSIDNSNLVFQLSPQEFPIQTGEKGYLQNSDALEQLKVEEAAWKNILSLSGTLSVGSLSIPLLAPLTVIGSAGALIAFEFWTRVGRLIPLVEMLLKTFDEDKITITPCIKTTEGIIDLFVRMPDRRYFAFMARSKGNSLVRWQEDRQDFFVSGLTRKGKKFTNKWDELTRLNKKLEKMTLALKKEHPLLIGTSYKERTKVVTKVVVLTGKTTIDPKNEPSLFVDFGQTQQKALRVKIDAVNYVVNGADLVNFLLLPKK